MIQQNLQNFCIFGCSRDPFKSEDMELFKDAVPRSQWKEILIDDLLVYRGSLRKRMSVVKKET